MQDRIVLTQVEPRGPSELIEIPVTQNGQQRIKIPTIDLLRSDDVQKIIVKGMRLITPSVAVGGPLQDGVNAPLTELQKMFITFYCEGWEKGHYIPLLTLNDVYTEGSGEPFRAQATRFNNWEKIEWSKSYIQLANGTQTAGAPYVVLLDVEYIRIATAGGNKGKEIIGPS